MTTKQMYDYASGAFKQYVHGYTERLVIVNVYRRSNRPVVWSACDHGETHHRHLITRYAASVILRTWRISDRAKKMA